MKSNYLKPNQICLSPIAFLQLEGCFNHIKQLFCISKQIDNDNMTEQFENMLSIMESIAEIYCLHTSKTKMVEIDKISNIITQIKYINFDMWTENIRISIEQENHISKAIHSLNLILQYKHDIE